MDSSVVPAAMTMEIQAFFTSGILCQLYCTPPLVGGSVQEWQSGRCGGSRLADFSQAICSRTIAMMSAEACLTSFTVLAMLIQTCQEQRARADSHQVYSQAT
jgi:hypothetical protein